MPAFFKIDYPATREARRNGTLLSRDSYISREKQVGKPGEPGAHYGAHFILKGADARKCHDEVIERDGHKCVNCKKPELLPSRWLAIDHRISRGHGGCWCKENLQTLCETWAGDGCHQSKTREVEHH